MKVLILGGGGREHALAAAVVRSPRVGQVYCAPGNGGTSEVATNVELELGDLEGLAEFAAGSGIDLTLVGPEGPLVAGVADRFAAAGLALFGPTAAGARLEGSKAWAKQFMGRHGIPTAPFAVAETPASARAWVRTLWREDGLVIKADGLAAGKGVVVADRYGEAEAAVEALMVRGELGEAGRTLVIERRLHGPEVSLLAFVDGHTWRALPLARDHKRLLDGDRGPNTGGMGALAPAEVPPGLLEHVGAAVMAPLLAGLQAEGIDYRGILYVGLLLAPDGPQVLEFNCRFGDPEAQALLPGLESDVVELATACVAGELSGQSLSWREGACVCLVAAAPGYPGTPARGLPITGLAEAAAVDGVRIFHAGTGRLADGTLVTTGGRVLNVIGEGTTVAEARARAYRAMAALRFGGEPPLFRRDIGETAMEAVR